MNNHTFRPIEATDFEAFYTLYRSESQELHGGFNMTLEQFRAERESGVAVFQAVQGVFTDDGAMIAYNELVAFRDPPVRPYLYGYVLPAYRGQGIGSRLLQWGIAHAKDITFAQSPEDARIVLQTFATEATGRALFEAHGFENTRQSWIMHKELDQEPPVELPDGFQILTLADHLVLSDFAWVHELTFRDHRGHVPNERETVAKRWQALIDAQPHHDPALFMLLREGDKDVGVILTWPEAEDDASCADISVLGVLPAYRRRGLGELLLRHIFHVLRERGIRKVGLSVDASSLTGAQRLYDRVGMNVTRIWYAYEYELRAGVELSKQG